MTEQKHEVTTFEVEYHCDQCQEGVMRRTGMLYDKAPPKYEHECNKCGSVVFLHTVYPHIGYDRVSSVYDTGLQRINTPIPSLKTYTDEERERLDHMYDEVFDKHE